MKSILAEKQYKDYNRVSRYSVFPYYYNRVDEKYIYGLTSQLKDTDTTYVNHTVVQGDTLDTLALYYFNNPTYYWVIADFNRIQDPYKDLTIGTVLRIPTFNNIEYDLGGA